MFGKTGPVPLQSSQERRTFGLQNQEILGASVIAVFTLLLVLAFFLDTAKSYESPPLLALFNTFFAALIPFLIAFLAARSYLLGGSAIYLLMGSGLVAYGCGSLIGGWLIELSSGPNMNITLHNTGSLVTAVCNAVGGFMALFGMGAHLEETGRRRTLLIAYGAVFTLMVLLVVAGIHSAIPPFYIAGEGPTLLRQWVLSSAVVLLTFSALVFVIVFERTRFSFFIWYGMGLALISLGLFAVLFQKAVGGPLGWVGRFSQYFGSVYLLLAVLKSLTEIRGSDKPIDAVLRNLFRHHLEREVEARTAELNQTVARLEGEIERRRVAQGRLRESERRYRDLVENLNDVVYSLDTEGRLTYVSPVLEKVSGYKPEEVLGRHFSTFVHEEDIPALIRAFQDVLAGRLRPSEYRLISPAGDLFWVRTSSKPLTEDGRMIGVTGMATDITERKRVEAELQRREALFRALAETARTGILIHRGGKFLYTNPAVQRGTGYSEEELLGMNYYDLIHPDDRNRIHQEVEARLSNQEVPVRYETRIITKSGKERWIETYSGMVDFEGERTIVVSSHDITIRIRRMQDLMVKDSAITSAISAIVLFNLKAEVVYANPAAHAMWGYEGDGEVLGRHVADFFIAPEPIEKVISRVRRGKSWTGRGKGLRRDDTRFEVQVTANVVKDENGNPLCFMASALDVTDQEKMREMEIRTEKLESLEMLTAGLAHELRNPLAVISSCAQLCLETMKLPIRVEQNMQVIYRNSGRASQLIHDLLSFARPSQLVQRRLDLNGILVRMLELARLEKPQVAVLVETALDPRLPPVLGDGEKMGQVFLNLILNAMDALATEGRIEIWTRFRQEDETVEVSIADNGHGIADEIRSRVFDPFFTTKEKGTGLGLSIVHTIVQQHSGKVELKPRPGGGTIASVRIPSARNEAARAATVEASS